jgi:hypothetical protein
MNVTSVAYQPQALGLFQNAPSAYGNGGALAAPTLATDPERTHEAATGFAQSLTLRLQQAQAEGEEKDTSSLASALVDTVDYIGQQFGADAASAAMGIVYSRVGEGEITEDSLGKGLLDVIRFTDRNFGFEGGDKLIGRFNGSLNDALNEYFDNGLNEQFYASTPQTATITQAIDSMLGTVQDQLGDDLADTVADILRAGLEDGLTMTNLRKGVAQAKQYLASSAEPGAASVLAQAAQDSLGQLGAEAAPAAVGATLDVTV